MIANKLTGKKGVLFTAVYVAKFNEMEIAEHANLQGMREPRLGEYNAAARLIVRALKAMNAKPEHVVVFLKSLYEPLGIIVNSEIDTSDDAQWLTSKPNDFTGETHWPTLKQNAEPDEVRWFTAKQIAEMIGIISVTGKPHSQAISSILNENIIIDDKHKSVTTQDYGDHIGVSVRYDDYAVQSVKDWFVDNGYPYEVFGYGKIYSIRYLN